jgi:hypothetical protein
MPGCMVTADYPAPTASPSRLVTQMFTIWNPLTSWLRSIQALQSAAQFESRLASHPLTYC